MPVLDVSSKDKRISLGLKQIKDDPWEKIDDIFKKDDQIKGKVLFLLDKAIIFLLDNEFEGMLPMSIINDEHKELFIINKEFDLIINEINSDNRKIVLDYKIVDDSKNNLKTNKENIESDNKNKE